MSGKLIRRADDSSHVGDLFQRAGDLYREQGLGSVLESGFWVLRRLASERLWSVVYALRYGNAAPRTGERRQIDPARIEYVMGQRHVPDGAPPFGVLGGTWDGRKVHRFDYGVMWQGLKERYEEDLDWSETQYYRTGVQRLSDGETLRVLDVENPTFDDFEAYLAELDELHRSIVTEGFDPAYAVPVNLGRDGEWILHGDGNHRTTIAQGAGVDSIPVTIVYRHERWQDVRQAVDEATTFGELSSRARRHLDHPDVRELADDGWADAVNSPRT